MSILSFLATRLGKLLAGAVTALSILGAVFFSGRRAAQKDRLISDLKAQNEAERRINETTINTDPSAALRRLRAGGQIRD